MPRSGASICTNNDIRTQSLTQPARLSGGMFKITNWPMACSPTKNNYSLPTFACLRRSYQCRSQHVVSSARAGAILQASEDLEITPLRGGRLSEPMLNQSIDKIELGLMMTGEGFNAA